MASSPVSEMNKPEAERCIEIALAAQQAGDIAKAERFLAKSISMFPTSRAQQLLVLLKTQSTTTSASASASPDSASSTYSFQQTTTSTSTTYQRKRSRSTSPTRPAAPVYTPEQREAARAVIRLTNHYHILQLPLPTSATPPSDADIKAAYRKQALKFHPDKNRAPEAEEAFKKVSAAFQCLSDDRKKAAYDAGGYQEGRPGLGMGGGGGGGGGGGYYAREEDISPEEDIFNMFFGGMSAGGGIYNMNGRRVYTRRRQNPPQQQQQQQHGTQQTGGPAGLMQLVHFLPLLLLFLFSFLSSPSSDESLPFSLTRTSTYPTQHVTQLGGSPLVYFTQPNFDYRYGRDRRVLKQVEDQVEQAYVKKWREGCSKEQTELKRMEKELSRRTGKEQLEWMDKLERFKDKGMENCESLAKLKAAG